MDTTLTETNQPDVVGVIGAGKFGIAIANLLAANSKVLLFARDESVVEKINSSRFHKEQQIGENITSTGDPEHICNTCSLIFPVVTSADFRTMMKRFSPWLKPSHILIHGTKGLDIRAVENGIRPEDVKTMSQVILEESNVMRVGCLAGPNLASEIAQGKPAATVIASHYDEVVQAGQRALKSSTFQVFGSGDLLGVELAGVLKNYIAIASGALIGLGLGSNARALLITRGMAEMIEIGKAMGSEIRPFIGLAGVGDLIATCTSESSRNFYVGTQLAKGKSIEEITDSMEEVAEGVRTLKVVKALAENQGVTLPICHALHRLIFEGFSAEEGVKILMRLPPMKDVEFIG